jgi:hemolysin activation/secretion protein
MAANPPQTHHGTPMPNHPALFLRPLAVAVLTLAAAVPAFAQTVPNAGQLLEESRRTPPALPAQTAPRLIEPPQRPSLNLPAGVTVQVSEFRISGAVSFSREVLAALVKPWVGRKLDIQGLNEAAAALTRHYQANGHLLSYAYLPAQKVADGVIELAVLEGRLENVQIVTAQEVRLRDSVVQGAMGQLTGRGPLLQSDVERRLLLLNDIPGITARAAFTPGASTGGAEMIVSVAEDDPLDFRAEFNNHGTKSTGMYRAGVSLQLRDVFGLGDQTTVRGTVSDKGSLVSGTLASTVPVGGDGWKFGASMSRLHYQLAGSFVRLGANGQADTIGVDASYPLRRTPDNSIYMRAALDHKRLQDELRLVGTGTDKRNDTAELGFSYDLRDGLGGVAAGSLTATLGRLRVDAAARQEWHKLGLQWARQQALPGTWSLYTRVAGQETGTTLDSSEKLGLAGPGAVRAYAAGELSVDRGLLATLELRYALDFIGGNTVASVFHDTGRGQINRAFAGQPGNQREIHGSGIGLTWSASGYSLNTSVAWRGSRAPTTDGNDPKPRLFVQLFVTP